MFIQGKSKGLRIHFHFEIVRTIFGNVYLFRNIYVQQPLGTNSNDIFCLRWRIECVHISVCFDLTFLRGWVNQFCISWPLIYADNRMFTGERTRIYKNCKNETTDEKKQNRHEDTRSRNEHNSYENGHRLKKSFNFF